MVASLTAFGSGSFLWNTVYIRSTVIIIGYCLSVGQICVIALIKGPRAVVPRVGQERFSLSFKNVITMCYISSILHWYRVSETRVSNSFSLSCYIDPCNFYTTLDWAVSKPFRGLTARKTDTGTWANWCILLSKMCHVCYLYIFSAKFSLFDRQLPVSCLS